MSSAHFTRRLNAIRSALDAATDFASAARSLLQLAAKWTPDALANLLGDGLELAALHGREDAFRDGEQEAGSATARQGLKKLPSFAEADVFNQPFREQIEFLRQKRAKPTKSWLDAMRGTHDRAFVISGATDLDMIADFQIAIANAAEQGRTLEDFRNEFDLLVSRYGWQYKGERGWRTRVIFETNLRTSHMAGRLKQMRDPDVLKLRPFWEYIHGDKRQPKIPRPQHLAWHGKIYRHDDPWWVKHFPPNGWLCSCGVRSLSYRDLTKRGKTGPDPSPEELFAPVIDPATGKLIEHPQGIDYGWDYMPGDLWERGLTPSSLLDEGSALLDNPRMAVEIDRPEPIDDLLQKAVPLASKPLKEGLKAEDYVSAFLKPFGASIGRAVLFQDKSGAKLPISDQLFRDRSGALKVLKGDRATVTPLLAEALMDPDEIWVGVARKKDPVSPDMEELVVDRRYIRADRKTGLMVVFEIGEKLWEAITAYNTTDKAGNSDLRTLDRRRGGKLVYKRPAK
ncbi:MULTISPECIES: PBECR2 nuclease fold domain-containing protein [unclassified Brucella]|uniref:PBECR2 nuclease fold domain-containing protein n=1 Tax=unclassified Brucella TaxID=2632610 RepID=UPI0009FAE97C|nr:MULTISPECIES: PBECR2 nuclease fold domain-containing protein [unclassified Brucella]MRN79339.1 head morphogenesis protein [Brucella sp. 10RB9210]